MASSTQLPLEEYCDICGAEPVVAIEVSEEFTCPGCQIDDFGYSARCRAIIDCICRQGIRPEMGYPGTALNIILRYGTPDGPEGWLRFMEGEWFFS